MSGELFTAMRNITGSVASGTPATTDNQLVEFLNEASNWLVGSLPLEVALPFYTTSSNITDDTGFTLISDRVVSVFRNGRKCIPLPDALAYAQDTTVTSLYKRTTLFPAYYIYGNKVFIKPAPTASEKGYVIYLAPIVFSTGSDDELTIKDIRHLLITYATHLDFVHLAGVWRGLGQTELAKATTASTGYLSLFEAALPTWSSISSPDLPVLSLVSMATLPTLTLSNATDSFPSFSSSINLPVLAMPTFPVLPVNSIDTVSVADVGSLSMPASPVLPALSLYTMDALDASLSQSDIDFSSLTAPTYTQPSMATAIGTLSIRTMDVGTIGALILPTDIRLSELTLTDAPTFTDLDLSGITPPAVSISYTSAGSAPSKTITLTTSLPTFNMPVSSLNMTTFDSYMSSSVDDIEKAQIDINKQGLYIQEYQADIQKELQVFNQGIQEYQAELQKEINECQADVASYGAKLQDNRADLEAQIATCQNDIANYQAQVNAEVQEWIQEEVQFKLQKWQTQVQSEIQEYQSKTQATIQDYQSNANAKIQEHQSNTNKAIQEFRAEMDADVQEWNTQKQADISKFQADVNEALGNYQADIQKYSAEIRKLIDQYSTENQADINIYRANVEKLLNKFTSENNVKIQEYQSVSGNIIAQYRAEVEANIAEFNANISYSIQKAQIEVNQKNSSYQSEVNALINDYQARVSASIQEYSNRVQAELGAYNAEINSYSAKVQAYLGELQALRNSEIAAYNAQVNAYIGEYTAKNNALLQEYTGNVQAILGKYTALVNNESGKFSAGLNKALGYLQEAGIVVNLAASYLNKANLSSQQGERFYDKAMQQLSLYVSKLISSRENKESGNE